MAFREAKIARNEARLAQLGLIKRPSDPLNPKSDVVPPNQGNKRRAVAQEPVRRSRRISRQEAPRPSYEDAYVPSEISQLPRKHVRNTGDAVKKSEDKSHAPFAPVAKPSNERSTPAANSVRSIDINIDVLILGENGLMGRIMQHTSLCRINLN